MVLSGPLLTQPNPIGNLLAYGLVNKPNEPALVSAKTSLTWRQLDDLSTRLASQYLALGLQSGDRVASLMPNRPALIIHYLACLKVGLVATPLNYRYMPPEIDHALAISGASLLLYHAERDEDIAASGRGSQLPKGVIRYKASDNEGLQYEALISEPPANQNFSKPTLDQPAFIYFTSGSTGKPKGVTHTQKTYGHMLASVIQSLEIDESSIFLPGASFSHIGGSVFGLSTLAAGGQLVMANESSADSILPLLKKFRPTILWMLPTSLLNLERDHNAKPEDFASIKLCISGGDKVALYLENEFFNKVGLSINESYGMTEIGITTINPLSGKNCIGSVGKLCAGYELSIRDEFGNEVPGGTLGRLWIRSPTNMIQYWQNLEATQETIVNGWLDTGDMMRVDETGYLWFGGRKKQIIIHDGSNICPQEVEEAIGEHHSVELVGVIGIHDAVHAENVRAYVTLKQGVKTPTCLELILFARERIGYKAPEDIIILDQMPLNTMGKVDRTALKQMAEKNQKKLEK
ncbi:acyl--CoA ligase [Synechocystis salina LEGE 06099]|uniref:class I adenylate-forming enzyme family protein n=1 Tax=Synechocystis salina TaxID=945780 RepID=UPI00187F6B26|nr:class I adenylate-forming enzyme family protein [Synechocystis salina]MBE9203965.1 acyl--CoA ligase [Synechocystis salina LEGE 06099]